MVTFTKVQDAQPAGKYNATSVDAKKSTADFTLVQVAPFYIRWKTGESEIVSAAKLKKLQKLHTWATDF